MLRLLRTPRPLLLAAAITVVTLASACGSSDDTLENLKEIRAKGKSFFSDHAEKINKIAEAITEIAVIIANSFFENMLALKLTNFISIANIYFFLY